MRPAGGSSTVSPMVPGGGAIDGGVGGASEGGAGTRAVRKWRVFPGRSQFHCDGRVVTGRQPYVFYMTCIIVIVISGLFFAFESVLL